MQTNTVTVTTVNPAIEESQLIVERIKARHGAIQRTFLEQGEDLIEMFKMIQVDSQVCLARYRALGYSSFEAFCESPEIDVGARMAWMLISVVRVFVHEHNIDPNELIKARISKLAVIAPYVTADNVHALVVQAQTLARSDLIKAMRDDAVSEVKYDAELERPYTPPFHIDWNQPPLSIYRETTHALLNELIRVRPDMVNSAVVRVSSEALRKFT